MEKMERIEKVLIIPDVHGRTFWKDAVKGREDWKIIFLGDYLDPYRHEGINHEMALENFKDILNFKRAHPENVTLLIGNHDCTYVYDRGRDICNCRADIANWSEVHGLFDENLKLFALAEELEIGERKYVFSHAPILEEWCDNFEFRKENIVDTLNNKLYVTDAKFFMALACVDWYRGGYDDAGSVVWADVRSVISGRKTLPNGDYLIFGHTQLEKNPILTDNFACLDCRRAFILDTDGKVKELDGSEVPQTTL